MADLNGKVALVTGDSRGIGRAVADAFRSAGATVVGVSRSSGCDVSRSTDVARLFADIDRRHGRLDLLVNNAGVLTPRRPMSEVTDDEWDRSMAVNLRGVFLCCRAAVPLMRARREGLIINLSSGAGKRAAPLWGPYAVAKWGVEGLTRALAAEVAEQGIRVVAVNPGGTRTAMRAAAYPDEDPDRLKTPADLAPFFVELAAGRIPFEPGDSLDAPSP